ncbi:MAG: GIY-YIG nuclease family protein [Candidatus Methanoperedens sp.]|nr:GIY-YIG nuclease family protein [Candidatus Methanoperedens sp.]
MKGVYVLILRMNETKDIRVGKLGRLHFRRGYYSYVGSAQGSGGFKRVKRHFNVAHGRNTTRKWHIDYLLPHSEVICAVFSQTDDAIECVVARLIGKYSEALPGFGCSDCTCESHLFFTGGNIMGEASGICEGVSGNESIIIYPNM